MPRWVRRLIVGLLVFNVVQVVAWAVLALPSLTAWKSSIPWLNFMSWYANFVGAVSAVTASIVTMIQLNDRKRSSR